MGTRTAALAERRLPALPPGWRVRRAWGPPLFVTHAVLTRPDGQEVEWTSRRHRKGLGLRPREAPTLRGRPLRRLLHLRGAAASSWWMGALFAIGSTCFAVGSAPPYFDEFSAAVVGWTFFVGSIFFTSAAYLQFREAVAVPAGVVPGSARPRGLRGLVGWTPHRIDWWAGAVQLVGTVFFNVSTFAATHPDLAVEQQRRLIWAPDVLGSVCFLVASWLAYSEVNPGWRPRSDGSVGWRIAALNLGGSIAFGLAALGARYLRTTGDVANIALVNLGTFVGAVGFFLGAALLPVESAADRAPPGQDDPGREPRPEPEGTAGP